MSSQKDEYSRKEELFKRREENLRKKDLELQESLVLFNKFLKENEQKRRHAITVPVMRSRSDMGVWN